MLLGSKQSNALRRPKRKEFSDKHLEIPITFGVLLQISPEFVTATNVPHLVVHHSPTGHSFGHGLAGGQIMKRELPGCGCLLILIIIALILAAYATQPSKSPSGGGAFLFNPAQTGDR